MDAAAKPFIANRPFKPSFAVLRGRDDTLPCLYHAHPDYVWVPRRAHYTLAEAGWTAVFAGPSRSCLPHQAPDASGRSPSRQPACDAFDAGTRRSWPAFGLIRIHLALLPFTAGDGGLTAYAIDISPAGRIDRSGHIKGHDFAHFYVLGQIANDHAPAELYDFTAQAARMDRLVPDYENRFAPIHGPQISLLFAPLARLPYEVAFGIWIAFTCAGYALCCALLWTAEPALRRYRWIVLTLAAGYPAFYLLIAFGQSSIRRWPAPPPQAARQTATFWPASPPARHPQALVRRHAPVRPALRPRMAHGGGRRTRRVSSSARPRRLQAGVLRHTRCRHARRPDRGRPRAHPLSDAIVRSFFFSARPVVRRHWADMLAPQPSSCWPHGAGARLSTAFLRAAAGDGARRPARESVRSDH